MQDIRSGQESIALGSSEKNRQLRSNLRNVFLSKTNGLY